MITVRVVQVTTDQIVDMVAVRYPLVPTPGAVLVVVLVVGAVVVGRAVGGVALAERDRVALDALALVTVKLAVVQIVDMVPVTHDCVAAAGAVLVIVLIAHCSLLQLTIRISWLVLLSRRPPPSVATTMSSIRTPNLSGR